MTAKAWRDKIKKQVMGVGNYRQEFNSSIDALSKILEQRDAVYSQYLDEGAKPVIEKISDRGAVNRGKNPLLQAWMDLNAQALAYWRDLGLTPAGLKKINEQAMKPRKRSALAEALADLGQS